VIYDVCLRDWLRRVHNAFGFVDCSLQRAIVDESVPGQGISRIIVGLLHQLLRIPIFFLRKGNKPGSFRSERARGADEARTFAARQKYEDGR